MNRNTGGTRIQHCSLCKNHGLQKLKKKHQCKFENCDCDFCNLTRRCQKAMRHQQRLWRHQKSALRQRYGSEDFKGQVCDKCRNHDILRQKKDHSCPYVDCKCSPCNLNHVRKELMKYQQRVRRSNVTEASHEDLDSPNTPEQKDTVPLIEDKASTPAPQIEIELPKQEQISPAPNDARLWSSKQSPSEERPASPIEISSSPSLDSSKEYPRHAVQENVDINGNIPQMESRSTSSPPPLIQLSWPPYSFGLPYLSPDMPPSFMSPSHMNGLTPSGRHFDTLLNLHRRKASFERAFLSPYSCSLEGVEMCNVSPTDGIRDLSNKKFTPYSQPSMSWEDLPKYPGYEHSRSVPNCDTNVPSSIFNTFNFYFNKSKPNLHRPIPIVPRSPPKTPNILNRNIQF